MKQQSSISLVLKTLFTLVIATTVMFTAAGSAQAATSPMKQVLKLKVGAPTEIAGETLQPGKYKVRIIQDSSDSSDPTLQFSQLGEDDYVAEGLSPYSQKTVLTVQASTQNLGAAAANTGLISAADGSVASGLEIRGSSTEYVFGASATSAANGQ
jgi:hypothetical protein